MNRIFQIESIGNTVGMSVTRSFQEGIHRLSMRHGLMAGGQYADFSSLQFNRNPDFISLNSTKISTLIVHLGF
jgi:hypothetical protein